MKKLLIFLIALFPLFVYAENTCNVITNKDEENNRELTCDSALQTTTAYKTSEDKVVLKNEVCEIKCSENIVLSFDPIKKVLAGTSFNYPLYVSGERKCSATYDYKTYEETIKKLVNEYATLTGTEKTTKGNEITNYYEKKIACDEFTKSGSDYGNTYKVGGNVSLNVETSTIVDKINYNYKDISKYSSKVDTDKVNYASCNFNENTKKCEGGDDTLVGWNETARVFGKYTMADTYVEKYTGEVKKIKTETTCNAGDRYFTNLKELTKPRANAKDDNGYKLTLIAKNIGNNISNEEPRWNLTVNCFYQVKNLAFIQGGSTVTTTGVEEDENYENYGNVAFEYRLINLNDPFPGREELEIGANWYGKRNIISSTKDKLSSMSLFEINLNRNSINRIKEYNEQNGYGSFEIEIKEMDDGSIREYSTFVENTNAITRK